MSPDEVLPHGLLWHSDFTKFNFSLSHTSLEELTMLPQPPSWLGRGYTLSIPHPSRCKGIEAQCQSGVPATFCFGKNHWLYDPTKICKTVLIFIHTYTTILRLFGFCPGQPGWASTRRNIYLLESAQSAYIRQVWVRTDTHTHTHRQTTVKTVYPPVSLCSHGGYNYYGPQIMVYVLPARLQVRILHVAAAATVQWNGHFACYTCYIFVHFS